jgi:phosphoglycolate phosphatase
VNVLFDLDGTLTDPRDGILGCIRHAMDQIGRTVPEDLILQKYIGPPIQDAFRSLLGADDSDLVALAVRLYRERFARFGLYENHLYPGIVAAVSELQARRFHLYIATSKPHLFATRIADHFGLTHRFRKIYGSELDGTRSNKADLIRHLIQVEDLDPAVTVMVGDREHDIVGARANRVRSIGVLWGYGSREELEAAGAGDICQVAADLPRLLDHHTIALAVARQGTYSEV